MNLEELKDWIEQNKDNLTISSVQDVHTKQTVWVGLRIKSDSRKLSEKDPREVKPI